MDGQLGAVVEAIGRVTRLSEDGTQTFSLPPGKLVRPRLLLSAAKLYSCPPAQAIDLAAAVELIHSASLIHDDILDDAPLRRGSKSAHVALGTKLAVLFGDHLFTAAFRLVSAWNSPPLLNFFCDRVNRMVAGEVRQLGREHKLDMTVADYFDWVDKKTGSLFECCCVAGLLSVQGHLADPTELVALGQATGRIFQLADDWQDYIAPAERTGKRRYADFLGGRPTLPLLLLRERVDKGAWEILSRSFGQAESELSPEALALLDRLSESQIAAAVRQAIDAEWQHAQKLLDALSVHAETDPLRQLIGGLVHRTS